ncbi:hypothetical protein HUG10_05450 [Halorarum halophilum]|uniref:Uncharacterized protein n=1 Tax=Halorarum halophilum TaxID=2743090 RepID=A0A7D5KU59_9EURY|nr:hypothetical protein [Halobaculum halophilum]QLG27020.1 hypothetical protein HUG10_05450 [Halobaculum halophilum]
MYDEDVRGDLGLIVLEAFAHDVPVVGLHVLTHQDPGVPDIAVDIRSDDPEAHDRTHDGSEAAARRLEAFETALQDLLLTAYAEDELADPVGVWRLEFPSPHVPDWSVEISFRMSDGGSSERSAPERRKRHATARDS